MAPLCAWRAREPACGRSPAPHPGSPCRGRLLRSPQHTPTHARRVRTRTSEELRVADCRDGNVLVVQEAVRHGAHLGAGVRGGEGRERQCPTSVVWCVGCWGTAAKSHAHAREPSACPRQAPPPLHAHKHRRRPSTSRPTVFASTASMRANISALGMRRPYTSSSRPMDSATSGEGSKGVSGGGSLEAQGAEGARERGPHNRKHP